MAIAFYTNDSNTNTYDIYDIRHMEEIKNAIKDSIADDALRMSRAFPSFKIFFIEDDIPWLGMLDDVFGYSAVKSISIHKSRKMATDTAMVELTNYKGHLDSHDFKAKDHADSIKETQDIDAKIEQETPEKMMLRPGTRVQIKLGYSSDASELENVFTGKIAEGETGDIVTFIAQGYGAELLHPIGYDFWKDKLRARWANPRHIINSLLKKEEVKHLGTRGFDKNGNLRFITRLDDNVFLAEGHFIFNAFKWMREFRVYHTTTWDVLQDICRRFPGYVTSVEPYDERGTLFFGLPNQFYTYTETIPAKKRRKENKAGQKIFRNYHWKSSEHHIISNRIRINLDNFYNRVTVTFYGDIGGKTEEEQALSKVHQVTLPADDTIESEYWRTKVVHEPNCETRQQAYNYALGNLLQCTKELYDGELVILGDPKIKPFDIVYIYDKYTDMYGPIEVREVTHNFDRESGFTTTIVPDLLVHINNPTQNLDSMYGGLLMGGMASAGAVLLHSPGSYSLIKNTFGRITPETRGRLWPLVLARLGWSEAKREPIGVTPLMYADKPYIAGFEGMKHESFITRKKDGWKKYISDIVEGANVSKDVAGRVFSGRIR